MFVYIQSLLIVILEVLCYKIFIETFGVKREENRVWKNRAIMAALIAAVYLMAMFLYKYFIIKQILVIVTMAVLMLFYLKITFLKSIILSALFQGLLLIVDYFTLLISVNFFQSMNEMGESGIMQGSLVIVCGKMLLFFAVLLIRKYMGEDTPVALGDKEWLRFILFPVFTIFIIAAMIGTNDGIRLKEQQNLFFVIACGLAGINIAAFYLLYDILKREVEIHEDRICRLKVKNQIDMYRSISENFNKQKKKTHEYKNQMMCIDSLIKKKNYDALEKFVDKISGQLNKELNFISTNHVIVDAVLNTKYQETKEKNIVFVFKINDLSSLNISDEDVVVILSNLLNNAIEACEKCKENKVIKLKFVIEDDNVIISVKNTCDSDILYKDGEIQTTKEENPEEHGIGIENIVEIITKYGGNYIIQNDEQEFYFSTMLPLTEKLSIT